MLEIKKLALRLASLDSSSRALLLSEIPIEKRNELESLIDELAPLRKDTFAFQMALAEIETERQSSIDFSNEQYLQQLLTGEPFSVKQQLTDIFVKNCTNRMTPHVQSIIADHLSKKARLSLPSAVSTDKVKSRWKIWS
jgi:hypothetical protein